MLHLKEDFQNLNACVCHFECSWYFHAKPMFYLSNAVVSKSVQGQISSVYESLSKLIGDFNEQ